MTDMSRQLSWQLRFIICVHSCHLTVLKHGNHGDSSVLAVITWINYRRDVSEVGHWPLKRVTTSGQFVEWHRNWSCYGARSQTSTMFSGVAKTQNSVEILLKTEQYFTKKNDSLITIEKLTIHRAKTNNSNKCFWNLECCGEDDTSEVVGDVLTVYDLPR